MPAPANDNFASAITLSTTLPGNLTGETNVDASTSYETNEPAFQYAGFSTANGAQSVWYKFIPTSTQRYRFIVSGLASGWSFVRAVEFTLYSGTAINALTSLVHEARIDPNTPNYYNDFWMVAEALLTSGTTYYLRVASPTFTAEAANRRTVNFDLDWVAIGNPSAPANDNFANAVDLGTDPADGIVSAFTTVGATDDAGGFAYSPDFPSVWYKFHSTVTESQDIHLIRDGADPYFHPYWELYKKNIVGTPTSWSDLDFVVSGDLDGGLPYTTGDDAYATASLVAGGDYWLFVSPWDGNGVQGSGNIQFGSAPPAPANDVRDDLNNPPLEFYYPWWLGRSEYVAYPDSGFYSQRQAGAVQGTTISATATGGDPTVAGFAPTRNVWYLLSLSRSGDYKIWVESAVDCVLGVFNYLSGGLSTLVAEDDDSGPGNQPEITVTLSAGDYWIVVDSKTEGDFTLKWEKVRTGTRPSNDDFANAAVISSIPTTVSGTTVDATAEAGEHETEMMLLGPKDTVWYKYVASGNGTLKIKCTVESANGGVESGQTAVFIDLWRGTTLDNLVRHPEPPNLTKGFFNHFDTPAEIEEQAMYLDYVNGETYYIRVQTPGGGSEDFTLYVETAAVYLDLQPSSADVGPTTEAGEVYLDLRVSSVEVFHQATVLDADTIPLKITPAALELLAHDILDAATVRFAVMVVEEHDCYFQLEPSFIADGTRKWAWSESRKWAWDGSRRWAWTEGEGLPQIC